MILNILLAINMLKWDLYACYFKNWFHADEILIKLNLYLFLIKDEKLLEKHNEIRKKKSVTLLNKNLIVNLYMMNSI